jgi:hypothetical protein
VNVENAETPGISQKMSNFREFFANIQTLTGYFLQYIKKYFNILKYCLDILLLRRSFGVCFMLKLWHVARLPYSNDAIMGRIHY